VNVLVSKYYLNCIYLRLNDLNACGIFSHTTFSKHYVFILIKNISSHMYTVLFSIYDIIYQLPLSKYCL